MAPDARRTRADLRPRLLHALGRDLRVQERGGGVGGDDFIPTYVGFIALVPILFFNYAGFEIPSNAGDEMENAQKDVPAASFRAFLLSVLLYGGPILAILVVLPAAQVSNLGGFLDAIKSVFTVWGGSVSPGGTPTLSGFGLFLGWVSAGAVIIGVLTSAMAWLMGANRAYAVAALDGSAPKAMGRLSKDGTPIVTNIVTGIFATIIMILASTGRERERRGVLLGRAGARDLHDHDLVPRRCSPPW